MSETPGLAVACRRCFSDRSVPPFARALFFPLFPFLFTNVPVSSLNPPPTHTLAHRAHLFVQPSRLHPVLAATLESPASFFLSRNPKLKGYTNDAMEDMATTLKNVNVHQCIAEIEIDGGRDPGHGPAGQLNQAQCPMGSRWCNSTDMTSVL